MEELLEKYGNNLHVYAAEHGRIDILEWALKNECIPQWTPAYGCSWNDETFEWAAVYGHLHILKWVYENECPLKYSDTFKFAYYYAAKNRHLHILKWMMETEIYHATYFDYQNVFFGKFSELHHINVMEWLHDNYNYFHNLNLKTFIRDLNHTLLHVVEIPDLVMVIKTYI